MSSRSSRRNEIGGAIGDQLRAIYDEVLNEPIADRFFELLNQLETDSKLVAHKKILRNSRRPNQRPASAEMLQELCLSRLREEPNSWNHTMGGKPLKSRETPRTLPSGYHHEAISAVAAAADGRKSPP